MQGAGHFYFKHKKVEIYWKNLLICLIVYFQQKTPNNTLKNVLLKNMFVIKFNTSFNNFNILNYLI